MVDAYAQKILETSVVASLEEQSLSAIDMLRGRRASARRAKAETSVSAPCSNSWASSGSPVYVTIV